MIDWELCKKFQCDHTIKGYMHNPEPILEYQTHKSIWDFGVQIDHLNMRTCQIVNFSISANHKAKLKESENRDKYLDFV